MAGLSGDAAVYRDAVAAGTGLDSALVTAWVACESGWGVTKAGHNYLNIGPGRTYPDVASAARDVIATLHNGLYDPVLAAAGGPAQLAALKASPWDAGHYANGCLDSTFGDQGSATFASASLGGTAALAGASIPNPLSALGDFISGALDLNDVFGQVLVVVVSGVFLTAAFGIIVLGLNRLTANSKTRQQLEGAATQAAQVAAVAAV